MAKTIDITLRSGFDRTGVREASAAIDSFNSKLMQSDKWLLQVNAELSEEIKRRASVVAVDLMEKADKTCNHTVLSAKQIEAAWRDAMTKTKPPDDAGNGFSKLGEIAKGVARGVGGAWRSLFAMVAQGGVWGAASMGLTKTISWIWSSIVDMTNEAQEKMAKSAERLERSISKSTDSVAASFDNVAKSIDKNISRMTVAENKSKELAKAEIELARQMAIAHGMDPAKADMAAKDLSERVDFDTEERRVKYEIKQRNAMATMAEQSAVQQERILRSSKAKRDKLRKEYNDMEHDYVMDIVRSANAAALPSGGLSPEDMAAVMNEAKEDFYNDENAKKARENIEKMEKAVERAEAKIAEYKEKADDAKNAAKVLGEDLKVIGMKREARELEIQNEIDAKAKAAAEERAKADAKTAEERQKAEIAAAQAAAKERERLDREAHQKRMADLRAEIDVQNKAKSQQSAIAAAAQSEFERAFAMYRDPERAAQEIGEEKARAEDLDRFHKDARRYGGQWRIDELSALMSAGDTQGVQSRLQEWRKNGRFDASTEALVRASAAEQTRTTAEDELRKISANTAGLAAKLDELLAMKE